MSDTRDNALAAFERCFSQPGMLSEFGFSSAPVEFIPPTKVVGTSFKRTYFSPSGVIVEIIFYPPPEMKGFFVVNIRNVHKDATFEIGNWLKFHKMAVKNSAFSLSNYVGSIDLQMSGFWDFLQSVFSDPIMREIIKGETWEDIPFDWTGIKS